MQPSDVNRLRSSGDEERALALARLDALNAGRTGDLSGRPVTGPKPTYPGPPGPPATVPAGPPPKFPLVPVLIAALTVVSMAVIATPMALRVLSRADDRPASLVTMPGGAAHLSGGASAGSTDRTGPDCLVGTWKETANEEQAAVPGIGTVTFRGAGAVLSFRADGVGSEEYVDVKYSADGVQGKKLVLSVTGVTTYRYAAQAETVDYQALSVAGGIRVSLSGTPLGGEKLQREQKTGKHAYTCKGNALTVAGDGFRQEFSRVG